MSIIIDSLKFFYELQEVAIFLLTLIRYNKLKFTLDSFNLFSIVICSKDFSIYIYNFIILKKKFI
jgi:hypothetical protein